jgi:hypothetical protein
MHREGPASATSSSLASNMEAETPAAAQPDASTQEAEAASSGAEPAVQKASTSASVTDQAPPPSPRVATELPPVQANMMVRRTAAHSSTQAAQRSVVTPSSHFFPRALFCLHPSWAASALWAPCRPSTPPRRTLRCVCGVTVHLLWPLFPSSEARNSRASFV